MAIIQKPESMYDGNHMDVVLINALLHSLYDIFGTMVRREIEPGIPELKLDNVARGSVSALVGMNAEGAHGSVALTLTPPTIKAITLGLLGEPVADSDRDAVDLAGELTNMLVGGAKRLLEERGLDFDMQAPKLLEGEDHEIVHYYDGQTVLLPVKIDHQDEFYIELNFI